MVGNVPRIRDVDAMLALLEDLGVSVSWRDEHEVALRAASISSTEVDAELADADPGVVPARRPAAGAPRRGAHALARRRLHRPPAARPAPRCAARARCRGEVDRGYEMWAPNGLRACDFFMDEASVMATENILMAAALTPGQDDDPQRRLRAARAEPRPPAGRDGRAESTASARTCSSCTAATGSAAPGTWIVAGPHRGRQLHGAGRRHGRRDPHQGHGAGRPQDDPDGVRATRPPVPPRRRGPDRPAGAAPAGARTTPATRSPRSTTAPGPHSPPTSPASRSRSRRRPRAWC